MKTRVIHRGRYLTALKHGVGGVGWSYAEQDGSAVLKCAKSWRKINGIEIYTSRKSVWILFRRTS